MKVNDTNDPVALMFRVVRRVPPVYPLVDARKGYEIEPIVPRGFNEADRLAETAAEGSGVNGKRSADERDSEQHESK